MMTDKQSLVRYLEAETARMTGKRYKINYDLLDIRSLDELKCLLSDVQYDQRAQINRAIRKMRVVG
jgi:hypothetical protein